MPEGKLGGMLEEISEGMPEGMPEGIPEGNPEGMPEGIPEGMSEGTLEGTPEKLILVNGEGTLGTPMLASALVVALIVVMMAALVLMTVVKVVAATIVMAAVDTSLGPPTSSPYEGPLFLLWVTPTATPTITPTITNAPTMMITSPFVLWYQGVYFNLLISFEEPLAADTGVMVDFSSGVMELPEVRGTEGKWDGSEIGP